MRQSVSDCQSKTTDPIAPKTIDLWSSWGVLVGAIMAALLKRFPKCHPEPDSDSVSPVNASRSFLNSSTIVRSAPTCP